MSIARTLSAKLPKRSFIYSLNSFRNIAFRCLHDSRPPPAGKPPLAFAFDIDGVLLHGPETISEAYAALDILDGRNPFKRRIPYILLTNGGGVTEASRSEKLSKQLGREIHEDSIVQAHTILRNHVDKYADEAVLVLGGRRDVIRKLAQGYGFRNVYTTLDVHVWNPSVWPFHESSEEERASTIPVDFSNTPISAVFVFHDPRNWSLDIQVLCDVLQSRGIIGGPYQSQNQPSDRPIELVFCNPDLLWRSEFQRPRLGQGGFREAFQAVYKALTGAEYPYVQFGKPTKATYDFAAHRLGGQFERLYGDGSLPAMYMIGDNPESDIAGANAAGWSSVLVETGVYDPAQGPPKHKPTHISRNVEIAVKWAIQREMFQPWNKQYRR